MAYFHMRIFWGAFDTSYSTPEYSGAALVSGGPSAVAGSGVGVRRATLVFGRTPPGTFTDDNADCHLDFMNITGGSPDDTWTTGDYTTMETHINAWWASQKGFHSNKVTLNEIRWYRVGTGVVPPNPAERVTPVIVAGGSSLDELPPQVACSVTQRTARRKQWGRTYLPGLTSGWLAASGTIDSAVVDNTCTNMETLLLAAGADDFKMGVLSGVAGSFFTTEQLQVDNIADVIRRRRWRTPTHRKILP